MINGNDFLCIDSSHGGSDFVGTYYEVKDHIRKEHGNIPHKGFCRDCGKRHNIIKICKAEKANRL